MGEPRNKTTNNERNDKMKFCVNTDYKNRKQVMEAYPSAAVIKKVLGGWAVFETYADYETWKKQA